MGLLDRLTGRRPAAAEGEALYSAVVERAREPHWYLQGEVPDTVDGRFDMVAAVLSLVLLRLEREPGAEAASVHLTERFIADMDGQLREIGIGDIVVGKHIGKMMAALGGRLGAYRDGLAGGDMDGALVRNVYRGEAPDPVALAHVRREVEAMATALDRTDAPTLLAGRLPS